MRKFLMLVLLVTAILLCFIYTILPDSISIQKTVLIDAKKEGLYRIFSGSGWKDCLGEINNPENSSVHQAMYNKRYYNIDFHTTSSFKINIKGHASINSVLTMIPKEPDSTLLIWQADIPSTYNPITRLHNYFGSTGLGDDMEHILKKLSACYSGTAPIYGVKVSLEEVYDSILIYTSLHLKVYPSTAIIYDQIHNLELYAQKHSAKITGNPMLNVEQETDKLYKVRIALPVDKELPSSKNIEYRRMMGKAKILVLTVRGSKGMIDSAYHKFEQYIRDYRFESAAIPFQSLVTDRSLEKDSSKWITKINYPVR